MSYIGQRPVVGRYIKLDQISSGFNGSNTGFSMTAGSQAVFPGTARNLLLSLGGVIQEPDTDFTISGSTLTFTTPPVANTTFFGVIYGDMQATGTPSDGTVLPASIATSGNFSFPEITITGDLNIADKIVHTGDTDTAIRFSGANQISFETTGTQRMIIGTDGQISIQDVIKHIGDTNTKIRFPANDTVSVETGGTEAFRVDSGRRLLIGTSSAIRVGASTLPGLQICGTSENAAIALSRYTDDNKPSRLSLGKARGANVGTMTVVQDDDDLGEIVFCGADGTDLHSKAASIVAEVDGTPGGNDLPGRLVFKTTGDGSASPTTRMTIKADGKIGVGLISPDTPVHIFANDAQLLTVQRDGDNNAGIRFRNQTSSMFCGLSTGATGFAIDDDGDLGAAPMLFVQRSNGNVGIGTPSPTGTLSLKSQNPNIRFDDSDTNNNAEITLDNTHLRIEVDEDQARDNSGLSFRIDGGDKAVIDSSGDVGIGTSSPSEKLDVAGSIRANTGTDISMDSNSSGQIRFRGNGYTGAIALDDTAMHIYHNSGSRKLIFGLNETAAVTIDSSGRLGVGLTPTGSAGTITEGLIQTSGNIDIRYPGTNSDPGGARYLNFVNTDTTLVAGQPMGGLNWIGLDSTNPNSITASILADCSGNAGTHSSLLFNTGGSERMRIDGTTGGVYFGVTSTPDGTSVGGAAFIPESFNRNTLYLATTGNTKSLARFHNENGQVGVITVVGSSTNYITSSDYRLKENITAISDGITRIKTLKPCRFNFKADASTTVDGFLAHEVTAVPEAITGTKDEVDEDNNPVYQGIDQSKLVPLLVAALKEEISKRESLEARVAALEVA